MSPTTAAGLFIIINTVACGISCWYALCGINACTRKTSLATRISFYLVAVGSFAAALSAPEIDAGSIGTTTAFAGVAIGFIANRRKCVCLNCPARPGYRPPEPMTRQEVNHRRRETDRSEGHPA
jgi:hypothetical protein